MIFDLTYNFQNIDLFEEKYRNIICILYEITKYEILMNRPLNSEYLCNYTFLYLKFLKSNIYCFKITIIRGLYNYIIIIKGKLVNKFNQHLKFYKSSLKNITLKNNILKK